MNDKVTKPAGRRVAYPRILEAAFSEPWYMLPAKMDALVEVIDRQVVHGLPAPEAYVDAVSHMRISGRTVAGGATYMLPIRGTIAPYLDVMMAVSGGTTTKEIRSELADAINDPNVDTILLDVHSPGGSVYDIDELAADIYRARERKHIVAIANNVAASAAYYLASQAHEIVVTPSGEIGSVGVVMVHADRSKMNDEIGVEYTYITYGENKAEGNPDSPLEDAALAHFQARVDEYGEMFVNAVARGRGVSPDTVRSDYGQGRMFGAREAVERGLADRIAPLGDVVAGFSDRAHRDARRQRALASL